MVTSSVRDLGAELRLLRWEQRAGWLAILPVRRRPPARNQNVPSDLLAQSQTSRFFNQYCPGQTMWLCRPADLGGTDLTFAFEKG